jgi:hypothetical protein
MKMWEGQVLMWTGNEAAVDALMLQGWEPFDTLLIQSAGIAVGQTEFRVFISLRREIEGGENMSEETNVEVNVQHGDDQEQEQETPETSKTSVETNVGTDPQTGATIDGASVVVNQEAPK